MGTNDPDDDGGDAGEPAAETDDAGESEQANDQTGGEGQSTQRSDQGQPQGGQPQSGQYQQGDQGGYQQGTGLEPNVAAALSYALVWITGIIFLVTEKEDEFVRFHAAQSVVVFGGLTVIWIVLSWVFAALLFSPSTAAFGPINLLSLLLRLVGIVAWLGLMFVAYDGRWFRVPIAADIADSILSGNNQPAPRQPPQQPPQQQ